MKRGLSDTIKATTFLGEDWAAAVLLHAPWHRRSSLVVMRKCKGRLPMPLGPLERSPHLSQVHRQVAAARTWGPLNVLL